MNLDEYIKTMLKTVNLDKYNNCVKTVSLTFVCGPTLSHDHLELSCIANA